MIVIEGKAFGNRKCWIVYPFLAEGTEINERVTSGLGYIRVHPDTEEQAAVTFNIQLGVMSPERWAMFRAAADHAYELRDQMERE
jgi:hypothetical protein